MSWKKFDNPSKDLSLTASEAHSPEDSPSTIKGRRAYKKPELIEYGSVLELTKFGGSSTAFDFFARRF